MSRIGKQPVSIPKGVEVKINGKNIAVKGTKGALTMDLHPDVAIAENDGHLQLAPENANPEFWAMTGTMRALVHNMMVGVSEGFEKKLALVGVGYRAKASGQKIDLQLGFSHPIEFSVPAGLTIETPSQTEIVIKGADKQLVGEVAAKIRAYRPPEPYKGKGVRYADEHVAIKEAKKK